MFNEIVCAKYHRGGTTSNLTAGSNTDTLKNYITTLRQNVKIFIYNNIVHKVRVMSREP